MIDSLGSDEGETGKKSYNANAASSMRPLEYWRRLQKIGQDADTSED